MAGATRIAQSSVGPAAPGAVSLGPTPASGAGSARPSLGVTYQLAGALALRLQWVWADLGWIHGYRQGSMSIGGFITLGRDPLFAPLRSEPRFQSLRRRLHFII